MSITPKPKKLALGVFTLAMMNIAAVVSLRGLPAEAEYGMSSAFYYLFAALFFLIPTSMVAAELASAYPQKGGVFRWIGEAYGPRWGFLAIWLQWIQNAIWFPTVLTFGAVSLAFIGADHAHDSVLAANKIYTLIVVLGIYWGATLISFKGLKISGSVTKWGTIIGTLIPAGLIIILGFTYFFQGHPVQMEMSWDKLIPDFSKFDNIVLAASIFLFYAGMEMTGVHVKEINNPGKNYPRAIFLAAIITVLIFVLGTWAIAFIIPAKDINLVQSLLVAFDTIFGFYGAKWMSPVIALCLAIGVFAGVLTWIVGPSKGLLAVGQAGYLPPVFQKTNKNGVQVNILLIQAVIVTILSVLFVTLPSVQAVYQILSQMTAILYLIMYMLMFSGAIYLRYRDPKVTRTFRIGKKGNSGIWIVSGAGFLASLIAFVLSFLPPAQISIGNNTTWYMILFIGTFIFVGIPFIIYAKKKASWKSPDAGTEFEPFTWEKPAK